MNEIMVLALLVMLAAIIAIEKDGPTDGRDSALRDRADSQSKRQEAGDGEPVLVEVAIPLECIGAVMCDFDGIYHVQVFEKEVVTDEETYQRVVEARAGS